MRFVVHQISALQGAAILAAGWREARRWHLLEGDSLGAVNCDRYCWIYEHCAAQLVPGLLDRPEPQLEDYEPEIEPTRIAVIESTPRLVIVEEEKTSPATGLLKGGWYWEEESA